MEIQVLSTEEPGPPATGDPTTRESEVNGSPLETIETPERCGLARIEETAHEAKAKPKRSAKAKAVRFEAQDPLGERSPEPPFGRRPPSAGSGSAPAEPKVKAKSRAKASTRSTTEETPIAQEAGVAREAFEPSAPVKEEPKEQEPLEDPAQRRLGPGRGRPPGARNKPKPPQVVERLVEKAVYEKPPQDLQSLLKDTLRKQELDAREQKRAYYSQLIRRNRF